MSIVFIDRKKDIVESEIRSSFYIPEQWKEYLHKGKEDQVDLKQLFETAVEIGKLNPSSVVLELGGFQQKQLNHDKIQIHRKDVWKAWSNAPLINPEYKPRAWKLDTNLAQIYEIPKFLSSKECQEIIHSINQNLLPSSVSDEDNPAYYRNSRTCNINVVNPDLSRRLDKKISQLIGVHPCLSDMIEGVRYDKGQYFKRHADYFTENTNAYTKHCSVGGQRTWTVMIYLNWVKEGGETFFNDIGKIFVPTLGTAICWNNLYPDGKINTFTVHEALPVIRGSKYVITKWFRESPGLNEY